MTLSTVNGNGIVSQAANAFRMLFNFEAMADREDAQKTSNLRAARASSTSSAAYPATSLLAGNATSTVCAMGAAQARGSRTLSVR